MTVESEDNTFLDDDSSLNETACSHVTKFSNAADGTLTAHDRTSAEMAESHRDYDEFLLDLRRELDYSITSSRNASFFGDVERSGKGAGSQPPSSLFPMSTSVVADERIWTPEVIFRVTTICVVMVLTLVGNVALIAVITHHASLRRKRVSVFLLNLAVGDLMVCLLTMTSEILFVAFGEWVLGAIACKLIVYGQIVTLASTTFLLTAMSIDRYQVYNYYSYIYRLCYCVI